MIPNEAMESASSSSCFSTIFIYSFLLPSKVSEVYYLTAQGTDLGAYRLASGFIKATGGVEWDGNT